MSRKMARREFLKQGSAAGLGVAAASSVHGAGARRKGAAGSAGPNILFVVTDDQNWRAMGCAGHPFLRTPHMDRIAREGVVFENAFVTTSLCSPSRASFLTGVHAHIHGVIDNEHYRDPVGSIPNLGQLFQAAGYDTAFIGKWHMGTFWHPGPRPGFNYWLSFPNQGEYVDPTVNEDGADYQAKGYMTDLLTEWALEWLRRRRESPFFLCLWHKAAHGGFIPADRHREAFPKARIPEPLNHGDDYAGKPEWLRRLRTYGGRRDRYLPRLGQPVPEKLDPPEGWDPRDERTLNHYRTLLAVDEGLGQIIEFLGRRGELDRTVVVFAGDNGFLLGAHRLGDKRVMFEESIRIPFLVRYPERFAAGTRVRGMSLNIDVAPTLLELAGVAIPAHMQGKSLVPMMSGKEERVRESFLYTYFREEWLPGYPLMQGVRTEEWKYVRYPDLDDIDELYDLANDPLELHNVAEVAGYGDKVAEMARELEQLLEAEGYPKGRQQLGAFPPVKA